jgi:oligopeptide/dipeptide ABC transporter ATP-binding protein
VPRRFFQHDAVPRGCRRDHARVLPGGQPQQQVQTGRLGGVVLEELGENDLAGQLRRRDEPAEPQPGTEHLAHGAAVNDALRIQALDINYAVNRTAIEAQWGGPLAGTVSDQIIPAGQSDYKLPRRAQVTGSVRLDGEELLQASEAHWRQVRGNRVAMVFQDPMTALNPMYSVGWQVAECLRLHQHDKNADVQKRAMELLDAVGLPEPATIARRFPHELSGGMRQRVVIAMAIANEPELLIADEPTTALDVTVQAQILDLLKSIQRETHAAMIMISHDLGVVAGIADRVLVMYAGKAVEVGGVDAVFAQPRMPYTAGLLASLPSLDHRKERLAAIRGLPPSGIGYGRPTPCRSKSTSVTASTWPCRHRPPTTAASRPFPPVPAW